jgi:hypothetical protein
MGEIFAGALLPSRVGAAILGSMALFGLMLASIGLYGVLLYATEQRIREIGIRVALGANRPRPARRPRGGAQARVGSAVRKQSGGWPA